MDVPLPYMIENYLAEKLFFSQVDDCYSNIKYGFSIDANLGLFYFMLSIVKRQSVSQIN